MSRRPKADPGLHKPPAACPATLAGARDCEISGGVPAASEKPCREHNASVSVNQAALTALARLLGRRLAREAARDD
jgi:hypothetical protein